MQTQPTHDRQIVLSNDRRTFYLISGIAFLVVGIVNLLIAVSEGIDIILLAISIFPFAFGAYVLFFVKAQAAWVFDAASQTVTHTVATVLGRKREVAYAFADISEIAVETISASRASRLNQQLVMRIRESGALKSLQLGVASSEEQLAKMAERISAFVRGE